MIVSPIDIELVRQRRRSAMLMPVERGSTGERRPCPLEVETVVKLQPQPFVKGTAITITETTLTTLGLLTDGDARVQGYGSRQGALEAFVRAHGGNANGDREVWAVRFVLGDHSAFYRGHQERYLRRKMGGGRSYTTNPAEGIFGEGAVPDAELEQLARTARLTREGDEQRALETTLRTIQSAIADLDGHALPTQARKDLRWMRRRAERIEKEMGGPVSVAA